jgi:hypothetical protein
MRKEKGKCKKCGRTIYNSIGYCRSNLFCEEFYRKEWEKKHANNNTL